MRFTPSPRWQTQQPSPARLTPDQRAIIEQIAKPAHAENLQYAGAPADPIGTEVKLPFRDGKFLTLVRTRTTLQKDGSVAWVGQVEETGERALLMLWSNALLTGYFAYKGTIYTVESLGGGVHAFSEMDRNKLPGDHPPVAVRDGVPMPARQWARDAAPGACRADGGAVCRCAPSGTGGQGHHDRRHGALQQQCHQILHP